MTVVVGVSCSDGVVVGSDSMRSAGQIATAGQKVRALASLPVAWAGAGSVSLIEEVEIALQQLDRRAPGDAALAGAFETGNLVEIRTVLGGVLRTTMLAAYQAALPFGINQKGPHGGHPMASEFVLVGYADGQPWILTCDPMGGLVWKNREGFATAGSGGSFATVAQGLMAHYMEVSTLSLGEARMIAYRAVETTCAVSSAGVGGDVQLATVTSDGASLLTDVEIEDVKQSVAGWKQVERDSISFMDADPTDVEPADDPPLLDEDAAGDPPASEPAASAPPASAPPASAPPAVPPAPQGGAVS